LFFSYLGLLFPFIWLTNLFFVAYWIFVRTWKCLLIGVCTMLLCWNPIRHYFPLHFSSAVVEQENVIKVLTYNVMGFAYTDHSEKAPNAIVQYIAESGADIVCLQEYYVSRTSNRLTAAKLNKALNMYPYSSLIQLKPFEWGLAVYSKYPIVASRKIDYRSNNNGSSIHQLQVNGKTLTLINNHLESFKLTSEDKSRYSDLIKGTVSDNLDGLRGTIRQKLGPAYMIRARQARAVAAEIEKSQSDYLLVCGDFNDTPVSYAHRTIQGALLDAYAESGLGQGRTYNQNYFWFRIDHIMYSSNMEATNCTVDKVKYSDHYPVWCYLKLN